MNAKEAVNSLPEYLTVPLADLVESSTNPRRAFDEERLAELAESIRKTKAKVQITAWQIKAFLFASWTARNRRRQHPRLRKHRPRTLPSEFRNL
jgi:hypothetical protein